MRVFLSARQRELMYAVVLERLTNIDEVWLAVEAGDWQKAERLSREYSDLLRLLADGLGWERGTGAAIRLKIPRDVLGGAVTAIRNAVATETEEQRDMRLGAAEAQIDRQDTLDACDEVLRKLGAS